MINLNERELSTEVINTAMCEECKGRCCKRQPCHYYPSDFEELTTKLVNEIIYEQNAIIDIVAKPTLFDIVEFRYFVLRARGIYEREFRTFASKYYANNVCVHLQSNGCELDINNRPGQGLYFIPKGSGKECFLAEEGHAKGREWYENVMNQRVLYEVIKENGEEEKVKRYYNELVFVKRR